MKTVTVIFLVLISLLLLGIIWFCVSNRKKPNKVSKDLKLKERIYPAIKRCVENRYLILLGFVAFHGFVFTNHDLLERFMCNLSNRFFISVFWILVVAHNLYNYWANSRDQQQLEEDAANPIMEILFYIFFVFMNIFILVQ